MEGCNGKDRFLATIRRNGEEIGLIEVSNGLLVTSGLIGENKYNDFMDLIKGLQGFDIKIDDFFW